MIWQITEKLYWGDKESPKEIEKYKIGSLICLAEELPMPEINVPFFKIPLPNGRPIPHIKQSFIIPILRHFISFSSPVLVYCHGGSNRSAGIMFLYSTDILRKSRVDVWDKIKSIKGTALDWSKDCYKIKELDE